MVFGHSQRWPYSYSWNGTRKHLLLMCHHVENQVLSMYLDYICMKSIDSLVFQAHR